MVESIYDDGNLYSELLWGSRPPIGDESKQDFVSKLGIFECNWKGVYFKLLLLDHIPSDKIKKLEKDQ